MARVQYDGAEPAYVPELGLTVEPGDVVEVPDDRYEGYVPDEAHRSGTAIPWSEIEAPIDTGEIRGAALDKALEDAGLPKTGTADEKRQRLAEHLSDV
jgi:hypothetical protein